MNCLPQAEPITARIRRRQEGNSASGQVGEQEADLEAGPADEENSPDKPPMTFQERIALERQKYDGNSPA